MTLSKILWTMGLVAAGAVGIVHAGPPASSTYVSPYSPAPAVSGPGCATPVLPGTVTPVTPSTTPPSTTPTDAGAAAGMAAAGGAASTVGTGGGEGGSGGLSSGAPNMIGDLGVRGFFLDRSVNSSLAGGGSQRQSSPLTTGGAFRISENESARPNDRFFIYYNYFSEAGGKFAVNQYDLHRTTLGVERTFLDGDASVSVRVPILYRDGGVGQTVDGLGDITLVGKYAFVADREAGTYLTAGLNVTLPTSRDLILAQSGRNLQSTLLQPWLGAVLTGERFYVQAFTSMVFPTNDIDTHFVANDIAVGWRAYQNPQGGLLTAIIPTLEAHVITPTNNRGIDSLLNGTAEVGAPDLVVITGGVHLGLGDRTFLTLALGTPVTGPQLFKYEAVVQLNFAY
jgi:hypothetical protein